MNLAEPLLRALQPPGRRSSASCDFALLFRIIEESNPAAHTLSHEPGVGLQGRCGHRGTLGVAGTYGAGALNMSRDRLGVAEKSPVVVLSGGPGKNESRSGLLLHHQAKSLDSQFQIYREITCDQTRLDDVASAPGEMARVLASCRRHSQPVYIEIPRDMVAVTCGPVPPLERAAPDVEALDACVGEILGRLASATAPVLMVGVEVRRFGLEATVAELARRLGLPVVTSFMGRGLLASANAPLMGTYLGVAGSPGGFPHRRNVGRPPPARRDRFRHQLRRIGEEDRHAQDHPVRRPGEHVLSHYPGIALEALVDAMLAHAATDRHFSRRPRIFRGACRTTTARWLRSTSRPRSTT
jgi:indolepyruvate decarboxylase